MSDMLNVGNKPVGIARLGGKDVQRICLGGPNNLLLNSDFSKGFQNWYGATLDTYIFVDTTLRKNGRFSVRLDMSELRGNYYYGISAAENDVDNCLTVTPGKRITLSLYAYTDDVSKIDMGAYMEVQFYDANKQRIDSANSSQSIKPTAAYRWQRFVYTSPAAPSNARYMKVVAYLVRNGRLWVNGIKAEYGQKSSPRWTPARSEATSDTCAVYKRKYIKGKLAAAPSSPQECAMRGKLVDGTFEVIPIPYDPETLEFEMTIPDGTGFLTYKDNDGSNVVSKIKELKIVGNPVGSLENCCYRMSNLEAIDVSELDVSEVTSFLNFFNWGNKCKVYDFSTWETSKVTDMEGLCAENPNLTTVKFGPKFDTSSVKRMWGMFYEANKLSELDVSKFDTSNVETMGYMFAGCLNLKVLDIRWFQTAKVTDMQFMFYSSGTMALVDLNLHGFDFSNVTNVRNMFVGCKNLANLRFGYNLKVSLSLAACPLSHTSALSVLSGLAQVATPQTLTFKATTYATLTAAEIALATSKGWTVASA